MSGIQFMLETEFGKSIALILVVVLILVAVGLLRMNMTKPNFSEILNKHAMSIAGFIIAAFISIQLLGDSAASVHDGTLEDKNVPEEIRVVKGINFTVGIILAILCLVILCANFKMCSSAAGRVSAMARNPFAGFGKALGFGRRRKKRRC